MARTERPRKAAAGGGARRRRDLSRDKLVAAALELIDAKGASSLTMRALAETVGVTPMALYNHFGNKRDLLAAVADHVVSAAQFDGGHASWRDQVGHCFGALRALCLQHPGLPELLEQDGAAPATVFAPMEVTVRALRDAGLDDLATVRTYFLLISFTLGQAAYQTRDPIGGLELAEAARTDRLTGQGYRNLERLALPAIWDFDASFAFGLALILNGVEATVATARDGAPAGA